MHNLPITDPNQRQPPPTPPPAPPQIRQSLNPHNPYMIQNGPDNNPPRTTNPNNKKQIIRTYTSLRLEDQGSKDYCQDHYISYEDQNEDSGHIDPTYNNNSISNNISNNTNNNNNNRSYAEQQQSELSAYISPIERQLQFVSNSQDMALQSAIGEAGDYNWNGDVLHNHGSSNNNTNNYDNNNNYNSNSNNGNSPTRNKNKQTNIHRLHSLGANNNNNNNNNNNINTNASVNQYQQHNNINDGSVINALVDPSYGYGNQSQSGYGRVMGNVDAGVRYPYMNNNGDNTNGKINRTGNSNKKKNVDFKLINPVPAPLHHQHQKYPNNKQTFFTINHNNTSSKVVPNLAGFEQSIQFRMDTQPHIRGHGHIPEQHRNLFGVYGNYNDQGHRQRTNSSNKKQDNNIKHILTPKSNMLNQNNIDNDKYNKNIISAPQSSCNPNSARSLNTYNNMYNGYLQQHERDENGYGNGHGFGFSNSNGGLNMYQLEVDGDGQEENGYVSGKVCRGSGVGDGDGGRFLQGCYSVSVQPFHQQQISRQLQMGMNSGRLLIPSTNINNTNLTLNQLKHPSNSNPTPITQQSSYPPPPPAPSIPPSLPVPLTSLTKNEQQYIQNLQTNMQLLKISQNMCEQLVRKTQQYQIQNQMLKTHNVELENKVNDLEEEVQYLKRLLFKEKEYFNGNFEEEEEGKKQGSFIKKKFSQISKQRDNKNTNYMNKVLSNVQQEQTELQKQAQKQKQKILKQSIEQINNYNQITKTNPNKPNPNKPNLNLHPNQNQSRQSSSPQSPNKNLQLKQKLQSLTKRNQNIQKKMERLTEQLERSQAKVAQLTREKHQKIQKNMKNYFSFGKDQVGIPGIGIGRAKDIYKEKQRETKRKGNNQMQQILMSGQKQSGNNQWQQQENDRNYNKSKNITNKQQTDRNKPQPKQKITIKKPQQNSPSQKIQPTQPIDQNELHPNQQKPHKKTQKQQNLNKQIRSLKWKLAQKEQQIMFMIRRNKILQDKYNCNSSNGEKDHVYKNTYKDSSMKSKVDSLDFSHDNNNFDQQQQQQPQKTDQNNNNNNKRQKNSNSKLIKQQQKQRYKQKQRQLFESQQQQSYNQGQQNKQTDLQTITVTKFKIYDKYDQSSYFKKDKLKQKQKQKEKQILKEKEVQGQIDQHKYQHKLKQRQRQKQRDNLKQIQQQFNILKQKQLSMQNQKQGKAAKQRQTQRQASIIISRDKQILNTKQAQKQLAKMQKQKFISKQIQEYMLMYQAKDEGKGVGKARQTDRAKDKDKDKQFYKDKSVGNILQRNGSNYRYSYINHINSNNNGNKKAQILRTQPQQPQPSQRIHTTQTQPNNPTKSNANPYLHLYRRYH